jgi:hypothetical protein
METKQWTTIDKSELGPGPWQDEPDKVQWQDKDTGLPCLAVRNPNGGHWCGYVGLPPGHRWHGAQYEDVPVYVVHGGLTFSDACEPGDDESTGICHTPAPGEPDDVWWLGFDCAHLGDISPGYNLGCDGDIYRTLGYVQAECTRLASEASKVTPYDEGREAAEHWPDYLQDACPYYPPGCEAATEWRRGYKHGLRERDGDEN